MTLLDPRNSKYVSPKNKIQDRKNVQPLSNLVDFKIINIPIYH